MSQDDRFSWIDVLKHSIKLNRHDPSHRFVQLASVTQTGHPRNRTLVFRGFDVDEESILLCTDQRSAKMDDFRDNGSVEVCWYFQTTREQYRLRGEIILINDSQRRDSMWSKLSMATKKQFFWPTPLEPANQDGLDHVPEHLNDTDPPKTFILFKISTHRVDYLSLVGTYRRIICERSFQGWTSLMVNP